MIGKYSVKRKPLFVQIYDPSQRAFVEKFDVSVVYKYFNNHRRLMLLKIRKLLITFRWIIHGDVEQN